MTWRQVGRTGVDAGMILITDPCYVVRNPGDHQYQPFRSYEELWEQLGLGDTSKPAYQCTNENGADIGVVVGNFGGDGVYPVYVEVGPHGRVRAAMILFDTVDFFPAP